MKIEMKINRYIKHIGKDDLILDNGSCIQVLTQDGARTGWLGCAPLPMSKKLFQELKALNFVYLDIKKTEKENKRYKTPWLYYYRFDIDLMIESGGYTVVRDEK